MYVVKFPVCHIASHVAEKESIAVKALVSHMYLNYIDLC